MDLFTRLGFGRQEGRDKGRYDPVEDREQLVGEHEKDERLAEQLQDLKRSYQRAQRWCKILGILFALSLAIILAVVGSNSSFRGREDEAILSPVPSMPTKSITFERDDLYAGPSSPERDQAWGSLTPDGDGFILLDNPHKYHLPPGKSTPEGQVYDISLFHQLHCLSNIRTHLLLTEGSIGRNNTQEIHDVLLKPQVHHIYHCFDYIRQALMCAGDMTIEWPREEADGRRFAVDGWGVTHQCRSWDAIMDFMKEHDVMNIWQTES